MRVKILEELKKIEKEEGVKILLAVESGSRAWGFASPDSDYDVRFIYMRNKEEYLRLDGIRDVIEWHLDDTLDINGWDLKKALQLIYKSNPTIAKWIVDKRTAPPMRFEQLVADELDMTLRPEMDRLLEMKKVTPEMGLAPKIESFNLYIENIMPEIKLLAEAQEDIRVEWEPLNQLFLQILQENILHDYEGFRIS